MTRPPRSGGEVRRSGVARRGDDTDSGPRGRGVERRVRAQDRGLESAQLLAGLQAVLLAQQPPPLAVGRERPGNLPAPVEGDHELRPGALAQGVRGHQAGQLAGELDVAPGAQVGLDAVLPCRQPALVEVPAVVVEGGGDDVRERVALPEHERAPQQITGGIGPAGREFLPAPVGEVAEHEPVELARQDLEAVAGGAQNKPIRRRRTAVRERAAQLGHPYLEAVRRARRRFRAVQHVQELSVGDRAVRLEKEGGEQGALLPATDGAGVAYGHRPQDAEDRRRCAVRPSAHLSQDIAPFGGHSRIRAGLAAAGRDRGKGSASATAPGARRSLSPPTATTRAPPTLTVCARYAQGTGQPCRPLLPNRSPPAHRIDHAAGRRLLPGRADTELQRCRRLYTRSRMPTRC